MTSELNLGDLRRDIDAIDREILEQLHKRMVLVLKVGQYKRERAIPVYDPLRERELLERLSTDPEPPLDPPAIRRIFERIVDESRRIEQHHVE